MALMVVNEITDHTSHDLIPQLFYSIVRERATLSLQSHSRFGIISVRQPKTGSLSLKLLLEL